MAADIDICNLALAHLGQDPNIASLDGPELSAEAELCALYYPTARDLVLEGADWPFAIRTVNAAQLTSDNPDWTYAHAYPSDCLRLIKFRPVGFSGSNSQPDPDIGYEVLQGPDGMPRIYSHVDQATLRYVARNTVAAAYPTGFVEALSWKLAAMLAGPIYKGDVGRDEAKRCEAMLQSYLNRAVGTSLNQDNARWQHQAPWVSGR